MANKQTIIGKSAPVPLGQQKAVNSLPVVFAEDQPPIPVEEQNKIQSEVALSLLGIPRAEVALGIFADVNTYDINPSEWSQFPIENDTETGTGLNHISTEAGAELVAAPGRTTILTSKRFFRYQPGRVSASTMGVRMNKTLSTATDASTTDKNIMKGAPSIKKWGIFDKYDGYYFEIANSGEENDFRCVRRTQAIVPSEPTGYNATPAAWNAVVDSSGSCNIKEGNWGVAGVDPVIFRNGLCLVAAAIHDPSLCYSPDNVQAIEADPNSLSDYNYNENYAVRLAYKNSSGAFVEHLAGRHYQFPFDQREANTFSSQDYEFWKTNGEFLKPSSTNGGEYIRLDAHCRWEDLVTNLSRGGGSSFSAQISLANNQLAIGGTPIGAADVRFGYDTDPSEVNSGVKVWNLLVNVQGSTEVTAAQFDAVFGEDSHRSAGKEYDPAQTDPGRRNLTLKEWFRTCVPKPYRMVYEWRPVRAMFSGDQLNGKTNTVRWSDVSTANVDPTDVGVKRPGDPVILDGQILEATSVYDIDFTKVTMWKIEFSWYGAVGALFLCYVPVANGEARWVRVHHMRASNQLDVASLGNATLPITYLTHAGPNNGLPDGGKSKLVKYGASYYIDGGDKGTVKLLSKSSDYAKSVAYSGIKTTTASAGTSSNGASYFSIAPTQNVTQETKDQLIGAYLKSDTTIRVIWVENDSSNIRLYFNGNVSSIGNGASIELIVPRRQRAMMALRAKDEVSNTTGDFIRNRIQLYPIKYGVGITDPSSEDNILTVNFIKNPLLVTNNLDNSGLSQLYALPIYTNSGQTSFGFELGAGTVPKEIVSETNIPSGNYTTLSSLLGEGKYMYAYMRGISTASIPQTGFPTNPTTSETEVLVRVFKKNSKLYIQNHDSKSEPISVFGSMLPVRMYQFSSSGAITLFSGTITHSQYEDQKKWNDIDVGTFQSIATLSGASVSQDFRLAPVANTGNTIFSLYCNKGGDQFDLTDYFAYNKEYISYPLTNEVDILCAYGMWESTSSTLAPSDQLSVVNTLSWEEQ
jgi:hypothetical protein